MSESSSYSSLLALVDSHLSRVNVQSSHLENADTTDTGTSTMPSGSGFGFTAGNTTRTLAIPPFTLSGNLVTNFLAEQVSNMLKTKQSKEDQQQKLSEEMNAVHISNDHETDNDVIDLTEALITPFITAVKCSSACSSTESLFEPDFNEFDEESKYENHQLSPTLLTCHTDLSCILNFKFLSTQAKCSTFGKILASKLRPFSLPYKRKSSFSLVQKFDFKSKSPCDILKEKTIHKI